MYGRPRATKVAGRGSLLDVGMYRKRTARLAPTKVRWGAVFPAGAAAAGVFILLNLLVPHVPPTARRRQCGSGPPPPTRVFVHLHKTAGNNLKNALLGFAKRNELALFHTCHPAEADGLLQRLWFGRGRKSANGTDCNLDAFARLPPAERRQFDFVSGHQGVGVHALVRPRTATYFTFLRAPLARKVSHYAHFEASSPLRAGVARGAPPLALAELLRAERERLAAYLLNSNRNYMTKRLAGGERSSEIGDDARGRLVDASAFAARAALRAATRNLRTRFFFVGTTERYAEGLCVLAAILNDACYAGRGAQALHKEMDFRKVAGAAVNRRETSKALLEWLPADLARATRASEELDESLYRFAAARFEEQLADYPQCRGVTA